MARVRNLPESDKGAMHFAAKKELFEIQRGNNFEFVIPEDEFQKLEPYGLNKTGKKLSNPNDMKLEEATQLLNMQALFLMVQEV